MRTLESLRRRITSTGELRSVVKTMKALSAVNIRQFEKAVESLEGYEQTVALGLQAVLRGRSLRPADGAAREGRTGTAAVVFGSDRGMCGPFNERIASFARDALGAEGGAEARLYAVGERAAERCEAAGMRVRKTYAVPDTVGGVEGRVGELIIDMDEWTGREGVGRVLLFHHRFEGGASYRPRKVQLLPVDPRRLEKLASRPWPSRGIPVYTMEYPPLFAALVRQGFFVLLYRAFAQSIAAENAARLRAMESAERNIDDRLQALTGAFNRLRQSSVTEELLDIVAGFEALGGTQAAGRTGDRWTTRTASCG